MSGGNENKAAPRTVSQLAQRIFAVIAQAELPEFTEAERERIVRVMVNLLLDPDATLTALARGDRVRAAEIEGTQ